MFGQRCFPASNGAVCLDKIRFSEGKSGFVWTKFITFTEVCEYCRKLYFQFKYPPLWELKTFLLKNDQLKRQFESEQYKKAITDIELGLNLNELALIREKIRLAQG